MPLIQETARAMIAMTGFRSVAIHEYPELDIDILRAIAEKEYKSLISFCREAGVEIKPVTPKMLEV